ncbi:reverse transcriptase domain-containing protein [Tanacetum coccineum]
MGIKNLSSKVDSCLVANQINRSYIAKEKGIIQYLEKSKTLIHRFKAFSIEKVLRSENRKADALSKIAYTRHSYRSRGRGIHLDDPTIRLPHKRNFASGRKETKNYEDHKDNTYDRRCLVKEIISRTVALMSTWMEFGGNTRNLDLIWEETDEITTIHEFQYQKSIPWLETASQSMATALGGSSDGVNILVTTSEVADSKETLRRFAG